MDLTGKYWEIYDDQEGEDWKYLSYENRSGVEVVEEVSDLEAQVIEIKRLHGQNTVIKVYMDKEM